MSDSTRRVVSPAQAYVQERKCAVWEAFQCIRVFIRSTSGVAQVITPRPQAAPHVLFVIPIHEAQANSGRRKTFEMK